MRIGVEGEDNELVDVVALDELDSLLGVGVPVAHGDVDLGVEAAGGKGGLEGVGLLLGDGAEGGAATDGAVSLGGLGGAEGGDEAGDEGLEEAEGGGQADDVGVGEQVLQEGLHVVERVRAAEVEEHDADLAAGAGGCLGRGADRADVNVAVEVVRRDTAKLLRHARPEALLARRHLRHEAFVPARGCGAWTTAALPLLRQRVRRESAGPLRGRTATQAPQQAGLWPYPGAGARVRAG